MSGPHHLSLPHINNWARFQAENCQVAQYLHAFDHHIIILYCQLLIIFLTSKYSWWISCENLSACPQSLEEARLWLVSSTITKPTN
jgi:hypothetical protein